MAVQHSQTCACLRFPCVCVSSCGRELPRLVWTEEVYTSSQSGTNGLEGLHLNQSLELVTITFCNYIAMASNLIAIMKCQSYPNTHEPYARSGTWMTRGRRIAACPARRAPANHSLCLPRVNLAHAGPSATCQPARTLGPRTQNHRPTKVGGIHPLGILHFGRQKRRCVTTSLLQILLPFLVKILSNPAPPSESEVLSLTKRKNTCIHPKQAVSCLCAMS